MQDPAKKRTEVLAVHRGYIAGAVGPDDGGGLFALATPRYNGEYCDSAQVVHQARYLSLRRSMTTCREIMTRVVAVNVLAIVCWSGHSGQADERGPAHTRTDKADMLPSFCIPCR